MTSISKVGDHILQYLLQFTLYDVIQSSDDFEDVKMALMERNKLTIDVLRNILTIGLAFGDYLTLCTLVFLVMAESIHMRYVRLPRSELKARAHEIGLVTFALVNAIPDLGSIISLVALISGTSKSPTLAICIVLITVVIPFSLPVALHCVQRLTAQRLMRMPTLDVELEKVVTVISDEDRADDVVWVQSALRLVASSTETVCALLPY